MFCRRLQGLWIFLYFQLIFPQYSVAKELKENKAVEIKNQPDETSDETIKGLSAAEKKIICSQHTGKFITYYSSVFYVENCRRLELSSEQVYQVTKNGKTLVEVDSMVIEALQFAGKYKVKESLENKVLCSKLQGRYVTFSFVDVYLVDSCKKRRFPDWSSYESHRGKLAKSKDNLLELSLTEFTFLTDGEDMPSVIDEEFRGLLKEDHVDLIPLSEACRGLVGKHVTYLGKIYMIEPLKVDTKTKGNEVFCQKSIIDGEKYTRQNVNKGFNLLELSSSKAISIPDSL